MSKWVRSVRAMYGWFPGRPRKYPGTVKLLSPSAKRETKKPLHW